MAQLFARETQNFAVSRRLPGTRIAGIHRMGVQGDHENLVSANHHTAELAAQISVPRAFQAGGNGRFRAAGAG